MNARVLTPTLIICAAAAVGGGIALARPTSAPAAAPAAEVASEVTDATTDTTVAEPEAETPPAGEGSGYGGGAGRKQAPQTTAKKAAPKAPAGGATLTISSFDFGAPLTVARGTRVTVRNQDKAPHTVTGSGFDTGNIAGGATGSFTAPSKPGTYTFSCLVHPSMTGTITVT